MVSKFEIRMTYWSGCVSEWVYADDSTVGIENRQSAVYSDAVVWVHFMYVLVTETLISCHFAIGMKLALSSQ